MGYVYYLVMSLRLEGGKQRVIEVLTSMDEATDRKRELQRQYPHIRFWIET